MAGKKIYFLSDFHLGIPGKTSSLEREKLLVKFFNEISLDAEEIFIVGDMFDFWYEYRKVVPRGYVRLLGKLAELTDAGIKIHFFVGNHDMWMRDYFQTELNIPVYFEPIQLERYGKTFYIGHGDGVGPGDHGYKRLKKIFRNPACKWLFGILPPRVGMGIANYMSRKSRAAGLQEEVFMGEDREWLYQFCSEEIKKNKVDYFVFGHRHLAIDYRLTDASRYINLGDWLLFCTYAVFDGNELTLKSYTGMDAKIVRKS